MSQRECSGLNWPPLAVPASQPVRISPPAVKRAGPSCTERSAADARLLPVSGSFDFQPPPSSAHGVTQDASDDAIPSVIPKPFPLLCFSFSSALRSSHLESFRFCGPALGVGQPAICASHARFGWPPSSLSLWHLFAAVSPVIGVCQGANEEQPLPPVGRSDTARSKYRRPNGVRGRFQVSRNKVEPAVSNRSINLFSKDNCRLALPDEGGPYRPEVTSIVKPLAFTGGAETRAWAASGPALAVIGPSGEPQGVRPDADPGKEMALAVSSQIVWPNIAY